MMRVFRLAILVFLVGALPVAAHAATLYLDPGAGTFGPGDTFAVDVRLNTDKSQCINAAHVEVDYPTATLRAVDFGRGDSIFSLWITDPQLDPESGTVTFEGGIPGGYCGRIPGDPAITNVLGKIIFTVVGSSTKTAVVHITSGSALYENNGLGTKAVPQTQDATVTIAPSRVLSGNQWIDEVSADTIPPEPFTVHVESTRDVFDGRYYAAFSTVDKQSGLDHYEIFEKGGWSRVTSPHVLADQSLKGGVQVRAIDKAGNIRLGTYTESSVPPRQYSLKDLLTLVGALFFVAVIVVAFSFWHHRKIRTDFVNPQA